MFMRQQRGENELIAWRILIRLTEFGIIHEKNILTREKILIMQMVQRWAI